MTIDINKRGFTLIEALVSITILIIGILSGLVLISRSLYNVTIIQDRIKAALLAQEGIELVRKIRDSNFIAQINGEDRSWNDGLTDGEYIIESHPADDNSIELVPFSEAPLKFDAITHLYNYSTGQNSPFFRKITIQKINDNELKILSTVEWRSKNIKFQITAEDHLYRWMQI